MKKGLFTIINLLCLTSYLFSQLSAKKNQQSNFISTVIGLEIKENNSDLLTKKISPAVPTMKVSIGRYFDFNGKNYLSASLSKVSLNIEEKNDILTYKKDGISINWGFEMIKKSIKIRNQLGYQIDNYSLTNLSKIEHPVPDNFAYRANNLKSKNINSIVYNLEFGNNKKLIELIGGLNISYLVKKDSILTTTFKEQISTQIYFGLKLNI